MRKKEIQIINSKKVNINPGFSCINYLMAPTIKQLHFNLMQKSIKCNIIIGLVNFSICVFMRHVKNKK